MAGPWEDFAPQPAAPATAPAQNAPWMDFAPAQPAAPQVTPQPNGPTPQAEPEMVRVPVVAGRAGVVGYRMVPKSQLDAGTSGALKDAGLVAANGATLGGFDNAVAGVQALAGSGSYQDNLTAQHAATQEAMQRPGSGFLYGASAMAPGMLGAGAASLGARAVGGGIVANLGTNAAAGALLSGTDAFNTADGSLGDRLQAAKMPAYTGAALGAVLPPAAEAIGNLASASARRVANAMYDARYGAALPRSAADPMLAGIEMQGGNVPQVGQRLQALGPGATLADTGEGLLGQTNRLANNDIATRPAVAQNLNDRLPVLDQRLAQTVDHSFGPDLNAVTQMQGLKQATATNGKQLYGAAFGNPNAVDVSPVLQGIDNQIAPGLTKIAGSGVKDDPITSALREARSYIAGDGSQAANIQTLHRAQDVIDDMAASALRNGNNAKARALWGVRTKLLGQMDSVNPEYAAARKQYASDKSIENAFENGRNVLATREDGQVFDPDLLESRLAQMSQPEQDAYKLGARKAITDIMGQARSDPAGLRTKLANDNGYAVAKLRQVFGDQPVEAVLNELGSQATMRGTNNSVLGNSATAFRSAADDTIPGFSKAARAPEAGQGAMAMASMAGAGLGHQVGTMFGSPELGAGVGALAGPALKWTAGKLAASRLAASEGEQAATRAAMGSALTSPNQNRLIDALMSREAQRATAGNASKGAQAVTRAILMQQAAEGKNSAIYQAPRGLLPTSLGGQ